MVPTKSVRLLKYGHQALDKGPLSGGLASPCLLRSGTAVYRIPDSLHDEEACPANCATATVMAALRAAGGAAGRHVVVLGAGMLGLTAAAAARTAGAASVIVSERDARRVHLAAQFGATHAIRCEDAGEALADAEDRATDGRGADVVLELCGAASAVRAGLELCRIGGCLVLVGSTHPTEPVVFEPEQIVRRMLSVRGIHNYAARDLAAALDLLASQRQTYDFARLVEAVFSLEQADEAFRRALEHRPVRVAVKP
jgi:alcohol dehydrogenase